MALARKVGIKGSTFQGASPPPPEEPGRHTHEEDEDVEGAECAECGRILDALAVEPENEAELSSGEGEQPMPTGNENGTETATTTGQPQDVQADAALAEAIQYIQELQAKVKGLEDREAKRVKAERSTRIATIVAAGVKAGLAKDPAEYARSLEPVPDDALAFIEATVNTVQANRKAAEDAKPKPKGSFTAEQAKQITDATADRRTQLMGSATPALLLHQGKAK
jgi:hypothetical protein